MLYIIGQFHGLKSEDMGVNYNKYINACNYIMCDDKLFCKFRNRLDYKWVMDNVSEHIGLECLEIVERDNPKLLSYLHKFAKSDLIGGPKTFKYDKFNIQLNSATCRYIKILSDLINIFGSLNDLNIVEIGGGYGGQCKIIYDVFKPKSYTIVDLHEPLLVTKKYLSYYKIYPTLRQTTDDSKIEYDLCISNYAYSEIDRPYQDFYLENIISYTPKGYMIWNFIGQRSEVNAMTVEEFIEKIKHECLVLEEMPLTGSNKLIVWNII